MSDAPAREAYSRGYLRGLDYVGIDPDSLPAPLSGEWAGESIPELLGDLFDEECDSWSESAICDAYEEGFYDAATRSTAYA